MVGWVFVVFAISACGGRGNALKNAADDAVRGTGFEVKSVNKTGDNAGTAVAEADDGSEIKIDLSKGKDAGEFVLDGCETLQDGGYDCTNLGN